jgi:hypothetical protein
MESLKSLLQQQLNSAQVAREYCGRKRINEWMVKWKRRGEEKRGVMVVPSEITPHLMTEAHIAPLAEIKMAKKINHSPL